VAAKEPLRRDPDRRLCAMPAVKELRADNWTETQGMRLDPFPACRSDAPTWLIALALAKRRLCFLAFVANRPHLEPN
jgi:hypothetical protein